MSPIPELADTDRRRRTTGVVSSASHSGSAPRDLGDRIPVPPGHVTRRLRCTLTRDEYYRYRYGTTPPA